MAIFRKGSLHIQQGKRGKIRMPQRVRSHKSKLGLISRFAGLLAQNESKRIANERLNGILKTSWMLGATELRIAYNYGGDIRIIGLEKTSAGMKESFTSTTLDSDDYLNVANQFGVDQEVCSPPQLVQFGEQDVTVTVTPTRERRMKHEVLILQLEFAPLYSAIAD